MKKQLLCCMAAFALTVVPVSTVAAQQSGTMPEGKTGSMAVVAPAKVYGDLYQQIQGEIIGAAEAMPADKYDYAPPASAGNFAGVRTFGGQVQHLVGANYAFFRDFGMPLPMTRAQIAKLKTKDELVQALKDSFAFVDKAVATITPENAFITIGSGEGATTRAGAATFCLAHANDHYGQMVEYLRMNGIVPPASQKR